MMKERFSVPDTYAVWSRNQEIRYCSTSGGAFSELAKVVLNNGGVVVGARYNSSNLVEHAIVEGVEELELLRQSKYVSSSLGNIYIETRKKLDVGKVVFFCGAPCQVAGLYSFLGREYDNLITMDFICRGMNSPKAFQAWMNEVENKKGKKIKKVWFKYKEGGWKTSPRRTRLDFEDGSFKVYEGEQNLFMYGYLSSNLYIRPCCGECQFKGVPRKSDITVADFWGIESSLDDDKGTSLVLVNSKKGLCLFDEAKAYMEVYRKDFNEILSGNPMFSSSVIVPPSAHEFLVDLDMLSFSEALKKHGGYPVKLPLWRRLMRKIKRIFVKE